MYRATRDDPDMRNGGPVLPLRHVSTSHPTMNLVNQLRDA